MEIDVQEKENMFDFLTKTETKKAEPSFEDVQVVLIKTGFDYSLCGNSLADWVNFAVNPCRVQEINEVKEEDLLRTIRPYAEGAKTVVVLYSDTPLLTHATFCEILERFEGRTAMKLPRGWVFKGEFVRSAYMLMSTAEETFGRDDFYVVKDAMTLSYAFRVLNKRILTYHKRNGVIIFGEDTVFIDANVEIEPGVTIYPNNCIHGRTYIGSGAQIFSGNDLYDCIICEEAMVIKSLLVNCKVEKGKSVPAFTDAGEKVFD